VLVYVDHNLGTVVKDAFVVSESLEGLVRTLSSRMTDPDQSMTRVDPAMARAVIESANGVDPHRVYGMTELGAPDLLTSSRRRQIITLRDRWLVS
jgi:hypothetical protein